MFGASASPGEIAGVVIIIAVFLLLGIFVCGCGPLPQPTEIAAQRWRERKERTARRRAERQRQRETELPFHNEIRPGRLIHFEDEQIRSTAAQSSLPSPPPAAKTRNRSPEPQVSAETDSDSASVTSQRSIIEQYDVDGNEKIRPIADPSPNNPAPLAMTDKGASSSTISVPPPVYSDAVAKVGSNA